MDALSALRDTALQYQRTFGAWAIAESLAPFNATSIGNLTEEQMRALVNAWRAALKRVEIAAQMEATKAHADALASLKGEAKK